MTVSGDTASHCSELAFIMSRPKSRRIFTLIVVAAFIVGFCATPHRWASLHHAAPAHASLDLSGQGDRTSAASLGTRLPDLEAIVAMANGSLLANETAAPAPRTAPWEFTSCGRSVEIMPGVPAHPDDLPDPWHLRIDAQRNESNISHAPSNKSLLKIGQGLREQPTKAAARKIAVGAASSPSPLTPYPGRGNRQWRLPKSPPQPLKSERVPGVCPATTVDRSRLVNTGRRALVVVTMTHKHSSLSLQEQAMEMDNLEYFMRHAVFPPGFQTALFSQVDYVFGRVNLTRQRNATDPTQHSFGPTVASGGNPWHCVAPQSNVRVITFPQIACDLCALKYAIESVGAERPTGKYEYVFSLNSGSRGPFFTPPTEVDAQGNSNRAPNSTNVKSTKAKLPPFTWIDELALGGEQTYDGQVLTGASGSRVVMPHLMSHSFGFPIRAWSAIDAWIHTICSVTSKMLCIYFGEVKFAVQAMKAGFRIRSLLHSTTASFSTRASYRRFIRRFGNPLQCIERLDPCQLMFVKSGGKMWSIGNFSQITLDLLSRQTLTQSAVPTMHAPFRHAAAVFAQLYGACHRVPAPPLPSMARRVKRHNVMLYSLEQAMVQALEKEAGQPKHPGLPHSWIRLPWPSRVDGP